MPQMQHVKGLEGILATLKALPGEIVSKGGGPVRTSLRKGALVFSQAYQENIRAIIDEPNKDGHQSRSTGTLLKAVTVTRGKARSGFQGERFLVRLRRSAKAPNGEPANKYAGVMEFGWENVAPKSPMRRAFEANQQNALSVIVSEMRKRTDAAIRKAVKKRGV